MTDQLFIFRCSDVRKYACDYRRGELEAAELRKFEDHLANCEACQDHVERLESMLDSAATFDWSAGLDRDAIWERVVPGPSSSDTTPPAGETPEPRIDRDALFARITKEIAADLDSTTATPAVRFELPAAQEPNVVPLETVARRRSPAPWIVVALAAGIAIGVFVAPQFRAERAESTDESWAAGAPTANEELALEGVRTLEDLSLQPTPAAIDDVQVFGDPMANWTIRTQGTRRKMRLDSGTVLVEFLPEQSTSLEFVANDFTVRVTGTIFYVSADEGLVGVVTGSVEVDTADGATVKLSDGQEWSAANGLGEARPQTARDAARFVDPMKHRARLEAPARTRSQEPKAPARVEAPRPPLSEEVVRTPRSSLRSAAEKALREGRYREAAQYYERMVAELSASDPSNASLRLDLSRIYIRHLDASARAATHLRRFVEDRPDDPATPSARAELCRIVSDLGARDPLCDER